MLSAEALLKKLESVAEKRKPKVLVVGDVMLDTFLHGRIERISPEAPVPVVLETSRQYVAGGAGNVAINAKALGADVHLMALVGDDRNANVLDQIFCDLDIDHTFERVSGSPTIEKIRVMAKSQQVLRVDNEDYFVGWDDTTFVDKYRTMVSKFDLVIISDYAKGTVSNPEEFIRIARSSNRKIFIDPKGLDFNKYRGASLITPNISEFEGVAGMCRSNDDMLEKLQRMRSSLYLDAILLTRSQNGMTLITSAGSPFHQAARAKEVFDVTGAGDTVIACLGVCVAGGLSFSEATLLANIAAGVAVGKLGTSSVSLLDLNCAILEREASNEKIVMTLPELEGYVQSLRRVGRTTVMTNGCFDILHLGHVNYLQRARALGDSLVVLLNSDKSVKALKGPLRPVNSELDRAKVLLGLGSVDVVCIFDDETPVEIYEKTLPDILVKGGDYVSENIAGADAVIRAGGSVQILDFLDGYSTSGIIERLREEL